MKRLLLTLLTLLTVGLGVSFAQTIVTGRVLDEKGLGLPGAGVSVKNAPTIGTVTDLDGNFRLSAPAGATLVIQAVGYSTQEVAAGAAGTIRMQIAAKELSGAVVTALAIRREKRELGYSATTLGTDDLNNGNNTSALSALQGKTAGVNISSTTGGPGGSTRVVLRGEKSVNGNNNALIVVDGIPITNGNRLAGRDERSELDFGNRGNDVNPEDIESITVLKGPAAAALYGSVAANGAIMITTKSGRGRKSSDKTSVTYQSAYTLSSPLKLPEFQNKYGQGDLDNVVDDRRENFSWGLPFDGKMRPWGQVINGQQKVKPYVAIEDNVKDFFNIGKNWENGVQLGGGNDKGSYFLSLNTLNSTGVVPDNFYNKYSIRLNTSLELPNKMYSSLNVNYINSIARIESGGQDESGVYDALLQTARDMPITEFKDLTDPFNSYDAVDSLGVTHYGFYGAYADNPYWVASNVDNRNRTDRVLGSVIVGVRPNAHWDIFNRLGGDVVADRVTSKQPKYSPIPWDPFYYAGTTPLGPKSNGGYLESNTNSLVMYNDLIVNYNTQLSENIGFTGLFGNNLQYSRSTLLRGRIDNQTNALVVPGYYNLNNNQGPIDVNENDPYGFPPLTETRSVGLYTSLRLDFKRQVFLELTGRNDWSSTLAAGNRSFFYPSASVSWVFTEALKDIMNDRILSFGKIRASYASVGNAALAYQNNNPAFVRTTSETGFGAVKFPFQGTPGFSYTNTIGNESLRPERTNASEIGVELALLRNRISFEATYYNNLSIDQIQNVPMPPSSGYTSRVLNLGDISNKGIELAARITPVSTRSGFRWEVFGTYTRNKNMVERLANGVQQIGLGGISGMQVTATVGKPFGAFYGSDIETDAQGRPIIDTTTGIPNIAANTVYKGSFQPRFIASWGTTLRFKGFSLNVLFNTKQGGVFYTRTKSLMDFVGTSKGTERREDYIFPNSVYVAGDGKIVTNDKYTFHPYTYYTSVIQSAQGQNIIDASYVKLQEMSLSYQIPESLLKRTAFGAASIGIFGSNLFIWTPDENQYADPEQTAGGASNLQGFDYTSRPSLRNYGARLSITF
jgi:TonB-linked SusC/RagA family outer membrane protein